MLHFIIYPKHKEYKVVVLLAKPVLLNVEGVMCLSRHLLLGFFFLQLFVKSCSTGQKATHIPVQ